MEPHLGQIPASANKKTIYGVLGLHTLPLGQVMIYTIYTSLLCEDCHPLYVSQVLVVITRRHNVGEVRGINLWQLETVEIIPVR